MACWGDEFAGFIDAAPQLATEPYLGDIARLEWLMHEASSAADIEADLASFAGDWYSEEAGTNFTFAVEGDKAFIKQRPKTKLALRPIYKDAFNSQGFVVWFTRDASGKVDKLHVGASRMRDMPFSRLR